MRQIMNFLDHVRDEVVIWPGVSVHRHRFGGVEFRYGDAEAGHLHQDGTLDIPYPRAVRDELLTHGLVEEHRFAPNSGWCTFHIRYVNDLGRAVWLMRLSYLRFALKGMPQAHDVLDREAEQLHLTPRLRNLLEQFLPRARTTVSQAVLEH